MLTKGEAKVLRQQRRWGQNLRLERGREERMLAHQVEVADGKWRVLSPHGFGFPNSSGCGKDARGAVGLKKESLGMQWEKLA